MDDANEATKRYSSVDVREALLDALRELGLDFQRIRPGDLQDADHLHSGGREMTLLVAERLGIGAGTRVLDVGSGIGGPARTFASLGATVTGVDPTTQFVALARELNEALGQEADITVLEASGEDTGLPSESFDAATLLHVGMNLADKPAVFSEVHRVLRPGGLFGVYDLMGSNALHYPVPWADSAEHSHVQTTQDYLRLLEQAGFSIDLDLDCRQEVAEAMAPLGASDRSPAPLETPILLAGDTSGRFSNVQQGIRSGTIVPRLIIAAKAG